MYFSSKLSNDLTNIMVETNTIEPSQKEVFVYCFEYIFEQITYISIFLLLGLLFRRFVVTILFLLMFYLLRSFGGGIHAPSEQSCTLISFAVYFVVIAIVPIIAYQHTALWLILFLLSIVIMVALAPIPSPNKPLSLEQKSQMKHKCLLCCIALTALFFILYAMQLQLYYGTLSICAILIASSILMGYIYNQYQTHHT